MRRYALFLPVVLASMAASGCADTGVSRGVTLGWRKTLIWDDTRIRDIVAGALRIDIEDESAGGSEIIVWAVKRSDDFPPELFEEAVVLVPPGATESERWLLIIVTRRSGQVEWLLAPSFEGVLVSKQEMAARPDVNAIDRFIRATNFGYNDFLVPGDNRVLQIVLNQDYAMLIEGLSAGISDEEKRRREASIASFRSR